MTMTIEQKAALMDRVEAHLSGKTDAALVPHESLCRKLMAAGEAAEGAAAEITRQQAVLGKAKERAEACVELLAEALAEAKPAGKAKPAKPAPRVTRRG